MIFIRTRPFPSACGALHPNSSGRRPCICELANNSANTKHFDLKIYMQYDDFFIKLPWNLQLGRLRRLREIPVFVIGYSATMVRKKITFPAPIQRQNFTEIIWKFKKNNMKSRFFVYLMKIRILYFKIFFIRQFTPFQKFL